MIVIGAGPAGLAAASVLHAAGFKVCMVAKKDMQAPIESVPPGIESLLKHINAQEVLEQSSMALYDGIFSGVQFTSLHPEGKGTWYGHHISKQRFCKSLRATIKDIPFIQDSLITGIDQSTITFNNREPLQAKYIIDGSGRTRLLGKMLKFSEHFYSPELAVWTGTATNLQQTFLTRFTPHQHGWTWYAPIAPDQCSWTRLSLPEDCDMLPPEEFRKEKASVVRMNIRWRVHRPLFNRHVLLCGDAAGIIDPGAGLGIMNALLSGIMAADAVVKALKDADNTEAIFQVYDDWYMNTYMSQVNQLYTHYRNLGIVF